MRGRSRWREALDGQEGGGNHLWARAPSVSVPWPEQCGLAAMGGLPSILLLSFVHWRLPGGLARLISPCPGRGEVLCSPEQGLGLGDHRPKPLEV